MNIMGIGPQEMMIIAVIALLVFGPGKLPEVMGQAGKLVRDFRRMSAELSGEFEKTIAEAKEMTGGLSAELGGMTKEVNSVTNSVKKDLGLRNTSVTKNKSGSSSSKTGIASKSRPNTKTGTSTSTTKAGGKSTSSASSSSKPASTATSKSTASTAAKKPAAPVATREDPSADVSLFEPAAVERPKRARKAVPSVISDPTPRPGSIVDDVYAIVDDDKELVATSANGANDALDRARQRRKNAGYARQLT